MFPYDTYYVLVIYEVKLDRRVVTISLNIITYFDKY